MPDLDVLLQDQAAAEGALSLCAIPTGGEWVAWVPGEQPKDQGLWLEVAGFPRAAGGLNLWSIHTSHRWKVLSGAGDMG